MKTWTRSKKIFAVVIVCILYLGSASNLLAKDYVEFSRTELSKIKKIQSKVIETEDEWFEVNSAFFLIRTKISPEFTAKCAFFMDRIYLSLNKVFTGKRLVNEIPKVIIASSQSEYQQLLDSDTLSRGWFKYRYIDGGRTWTKLNLYSYTKPGVKKFEKFYTPILKHEGTHLVLRLQLSIKKIPKFVNEGIANYYQFWDFKENSPSNRKKNSPNLKIAKDSYELNEIPPLKELLYITKWDADQYGTITKMRYALAETFAAYLLETEEGKKVMEQVFEDIENEVPVLSTISDSNFESIEKDWHEFIKKYCF